MSSKRLIVILAVLIAFSSDLIGQKKRKNKDDSDTPDLVQSLSKDDKMQAEYYFVEAEKYFILDQYEKALELFEESLKYDDQNSGTYFKIGQTNFSLGKNSEALGPLMKAKELDSTNKYYYIMLADIYTGMADFSQAAEMYEEMMAKIPGNENYLFELAALYLYQNELDKSLEVYEKANDHFGLMEEVVYQKQQIYLKQGKPTLAIDEIRRLVDSYPDVRAYIIDMVKLMIENGQEAEAIVELEKLIEKDPTQTEASIMLSEAYRKTGDREKAMEALKVAFENPSLNFQAKLQLLAGYMAQLPDVQIENLAVELSQRLIDAHPDESKGFAIAGDLQIQLGNKEKALEYYRKAVELDNSNFNLWQNVIQLEMERSDYDKVISHSEEALEYFPNQAVLYYFNGSAHLYKNEYQSAINSFNQGKKFAANNELKSVFHGQLGDAYNGVGDNNNSDLAYEESLKSNPDNDHALNNYSYYLSLRKENLERAIEMSTKLVKKYPENSTYLDTHAWVLYMLGRYEEAKDFLEKAIRDENASGTIIEHYGDVMFKLGDDKKAVELWINAKNKSGASDLIDKKIADKKLYE
ncbi:MAG: tetratricopeptide repeat protein [Bacteroidetes bacterium]|nr:tetratricopeptide repeat protein [Bacteroidota bacterium]MDA1121998.1 tetratricopeptide repeat protein [Bacteroidota bacterium]